MTKFSRPRTRRALLVVALAATLAMFALWAGGCTSDDPNPVGAGIPGDIDLNDLEVIRITGFGEWGSVIVPDPDFPLAGSEILYFGHNDEVQSAILARYDFSDLDSLLPEGYELTADNIVSLKFRLFLADAYRPEVETKGEFDKVFEFRTLNDTLDTSLYPGELPSPGELMFSVTDIPDLVEVDFNNKNLFLDWVENGHTGIMIIEGGGSADGLVGYASSELELFTELANEAVGTTVGPTLTVDFVDTEDDTLVFTYPPMADVSTFHVLSEQVESPEDGFILRTHLREYPWFSIDLVDLPDNALVNRAILRLGIDADASYGPPQSIVLSQVPHSLVAGMDTLTFEAMEDSLTFAAGLTTVDLANFVDVEEPLIGFDVTNLVQRAANGVIEGEFTFILTAGEDQFPLYDTTIHDPEFYLTKYGFMGTNHAEFPPTLEITYTVFSGGVQ